MYLLTEFAGVWYIASSIIAYLLNSVTAFALQKFWTFQNRDPQSTQRQLLEYVCLRLVLLLTSTTLLYVLVEFAGIHYLLAPFLLTIPITVVSFLLTKKIFTH